MQASLLQAQIALLDFQAVRYLVEGQVAQQVGNDHPTFMPTSAYLTKDGYLNLSSPGNLWLRLCDAVGHPELADRAEFATGPARSRNRELLKQELNAIFSAKTSTQWIELLNAAGVPCGPIYTMDQVFDDPQVKHLKAAAPVTHPRLGEMRILAQAVGLSRTPASIVRATAEMGEHTDEVLAELGF